MLFISKLSHDKAYTAEVKYMYSYAMHTYLYVGGVHMIFEASDETDRFKQASFRLIVRTKASIYGICPPVSSQHGLIEVWVSFNQKSCPVSRNLKEQRI